VQANTPADSDAQPLEPKNPLLPPCKANTGIKSNGKKLANTSSQRPKATWHSTFNPADGNGYGEVGNPKREPHHRRHH